MLPGDHLPTVESGCRLAATDSLFIVGGEDAEPFQYPFVALVGYRRKDRTTGIRYGCGGSLINNW